MEKITVLKTGTPLTGEYDEEVDVLYLFWGEPRMAERLDIGGGVVVRYDETQKEIVGLTIRGLRTRIEKYIEEFARQTRVRPFIESLAQLVKNVREYQKAVQESRIIKPASVRAWYYIPALDMVAASRFIGYSDMDAAEYDNATYIHGGDTERHL